MENPIFMALRMQAMKKSPNNGPATEPSTFNPNSDITERRLIKKPVNGEVNTVSHNANIGNEQASSDPIVNRGTDSSAKSLGYRVFLGNLLKRSLLIFPQSSKLRKHLRRILGHWTFEAFMLVVIFISSLILVIENPFEDPQSFQQVSAFSSLSDPFRFF